MFGLEKYIETGNLPAILVELVRTRASQVNGCAFCIQLHSQAAQKNGETVERLLALPAWRESALFSFQERTALELTEEVTLISEHGVSDRVYGNLSAHFDEQQIAQLIVLIAAINAWNRIAVSTHAQ
jgi:AhpD family alkylhydroperoxidase